MNTAAAAVLSVALAACLSGCQPRPVADAGRDLDSEPAPVATDDAGGGEPATSQPEAAAGRRFRCREILVATRPGPGDDRLTLSLSGRKLTLTRRESASGAGDAYADGHGNAFRLKGDAAKLVLRGDTLRECTSTDQVSPWDAAAVRGVRFRAIGQEPGWLLEVGSGDRPTLSAQLDYGERDILVENAEPTADGGGFEGTTADGTVVRLDVERKACADPMSGEPFEASARLQVGERSYAGCGAFLGD